MSLIFDNISVSIKTSLHKWSPSINVFSIQINVVLPSSYMNFNHAKWFNLIGRICGQKVPIWYSVDDFSILYYFRITK